MPSVPPPPPPPPKTKQVNKHVSTAIDVANFTWKVLRMTKQIEFTVATQDPFTGKLKSSISHTVDLTDDEHKHLEKGGKLVVAHLCGYQAHVKI